MEEIQQKGRFEAAFFLYAFLARRSGRKSGICRMARAAEDGLTHSMNESARLWFLQPPVCFFLCFLYAPAFP
jgi:hypothetical protein